MFVQGSLRKVIEAAEVEVHSDHSLGISIFSFKKVLFDNTL